MRKRDRKERPPQRHGMAKKRGWCFYTDREATHAAREWWHYSKQAQHQHPTAPRWTTPSVAAVSASTPDVHPAFIAMSTNSTNSTVNLGADFETDLIVPLYAIIFILSILGNSLVVITLMQNRRMRTVTNVFLLNLAIADLLLGVFCMPFTLVGQLLSNFIFGYAMCKVIPYFQAVSVFVTVWTLVAISMERYFAICRPLQSRQWQTRFHAYKVIGYVWLAAFVLNLPILVMSQLKPTKDKGHQKCREEWPSKLSEQIFNLSLEMLLLLVPLTVMGVAYALIVTKLWKGLRREIKHSNNRNNPAGKCLNVMWPQSSLKSELDVLKFIDALLFPCVRQGDESVALRPLEASNKPSQVQVRQHATICSAYAERSMDAKRKVIRMLFVLVVEFFVCWTPLHVLNTWYLLCPKHLYRAIGKKEVLLVQLLAYTSSCCNPITYCFMNKKFRQAFVDVFDCCKGAAVTLAATRGTSANDSVIFEVRPTTTAKSLAALEMEDCV
ncbi:cholecystokinin receptor type A-like [Cloeon dipterum]|uniref:cholecystokinin receptor type A-like n=1 Tax=Cloeon dipterum TaxID=197152 RepID=UPI00322090B9